MDIHFTGLPTDDILAVKAANRDAYGLTPERHLSDGGAYPCRHCLGETPHGEDYLILAHRPFRGLNAYTETGPIFLCAQDCAAYTPSARVPDILVSARYLLRGYTADERILYGTGQIVETALLADAARALLHDDRIAFADIRSAANNCFQCRVVRASG